MMGNNTNSNNNLSLEHPSASPNMVAAASAALSAAAALDPLLQVISMIYSKEVPLLDIIFENPVIS